MARPVDDRLMMESYQQDRKNKIDEGILDRLRANNAAKKSAPSLGKKVGQTAKAIGSGIAAGFGGSGKGLQQVQKDRQTQASSMANEKINSIMSSYFTKIQDLEGSLEKDLKKLGVNDDTLSKSNPEAWKALQQLRGAVGQLSLDTGEEGRFKSSQSKIPRASTEAPVESEPVQPEQ